MPTIDEGTRVMQNPELDADVAAAARDVVRRLWARDHTPWGADPEEIADRFGWLDAAERAAGDLRLVSTLADAVAADGVTDAVLVGMGGSSLYPRVLAGLTDAPRIRLRVLDSTDPAAVADLAQTTDWATTLLIPASKSGSTIETVSHLAFFADRIAAAGVTPRGHRIVPVTDPGSPLDTAAAAQAFRAVVHGHPDVGGRYAALTPFGWWPAALLGLDLDVHRRAAWQALDAARSHDLDVNVAARFGAVLAQQARAGRDKLTLLLPEGWDDFGAWIEQLVAESTGKHGVGLLPVRFETPDNATFGPDRLVVIVETPGVAGPPDDGFDGAPVVRWRVGGHDDLAGEVVRWEIATAVCCALLGVNAFDQPDVASAKAATEQVLATGADLPRPTRADDVLTTIAPGDYVAILGFVPPDGEAEVALRATADRIRARWNVPVTVGIGPRYLHSTGQYHKGGPDRGVFLVVVGDDPDDLEIPGRGLTFGQLKRAQAAGDLAALTARGRRVAHVAIDALP